MSNQYQEVEVNHWGNRLGNSFVAALLGVGLFFASFFVLYWNEGRIDFSQVAKTAVEISATAPNIATQGKLVSTTGNITSAQRLGDRLFLKEGNYIVVERQVETYAWVEEKKTETKKSLGGSETTTTTYTYDAKWTADPANSDSFKYSKSYKNLVKTAEGFRYNYRLKGDREGTYHQSERAIAAQTYKVSEAKVGVYKVNVPDLQILSLKNLLLEPQKLSLDESVSLQGKYIYAGKDSLATPHIGDLRIRYAALPADTSVTVFGQLSAPDRITPYLHKSKHRLYDLFPGSREQAIAKLRSNYVVMLWVFRLGGFLCMWFGLNFVAAPLSEALSFIPFLSSLTENMTLLTSFVGAFVLSTITILVSMLLHHPIALVLALITTIVAIQILRRIRPA
uniref:TMEM43 family protein n=1 Tax=Trichocoleus desertorum TaxID=1481672 RepID=UPI0025B4B46A|nr:TMEM43 family protein [Trichocoleus desertorum]